MAASKKTSAREFRTLPVRLSDDELLAYGDEAARRMATADSEEDALRLDVKERKKQIEQKRAQAKDLLRCVREKHEDREVECERVANFGTRQLIVARLDTGEVVQTRALTHDELQGRLFAVRGKDDAAGDDGDA